MEQTITFGTVVSVRVLVAMPGQPRDRALVVQWGPKVDMLVRSGRYELVEVQPNAPAPTLPEPQPRPEPQPETPPDPEPQPDPEPDPLPTDEPAASRRRSRS